MKELIEVMAPVFCMLSIWYVLDANKDHEKRLNHLESVTFESSRCPDNKTFSLVNLGR